MHENEIGRFVVNSALTVHKNLGPGLLECGYRIDLWIERKVILEIKSVDALNAIHMAQILTYLKLSNNKLGFLLNFNVAKIKYGIRRVVNNL